MHEYKKMVLPTLYIFLAVIGFQYIYRGTGTIACSIEGTCSFRYPMLLWVPLGIALLYVSLMLWRGKSWKDLIPAGIFLLLCISLYFVIIGGDCIAYLLNPPEMPEAV